MQKQCVVLVALLCCSSLAGAGEDPLPALLAAYRTAPQGYPTGKDERGIPYAQPDTSVWFRWHFYHDEAIPRFEEAKMVPHVDAYNPLEGEGVKAGPKSKANFVFVAEHVTEGKQALKATFPAGSARAGDDQGIWIASLCGEFFSAGARYRASCFWANYLWFKIDIFNPSQTDIRASVARVPMLLKPGHNVVAVKTADAAGMHHFGYGYECWFPNVPITVDALQGEVTLYLDHARMEQELPAVMQEKGKLIHFPLWGDEKQQNRQPGWISVLPDTLYSKERGYGWTQPKKSRENTGVHGGFRSMECGLLWSGAKYSDCPLRVDLPPGEYGVHVVSSTFGYAGNDEAIRALGGVVKLNGKDVVLLPPLKPRGDQDREIVLGGERWDFRPGPCIWEGLIKPSYLYLSKTVYASVAQEGLQIEFPRDFEINALLIFPASGKDEALKELGRFNFLLAQSWDVAHGWMKGPFAETTHYLGDHEEAAHPESVPEKLKALELSESDWKRGYVAFHRGLTEPVYPDSIPSPSEARPKELEARASPGEIASVTLGLLPLQAGKSIRVRIGDLKAKSGAGIPQSKTDIRVSRYQAGVMGYHHHHRAYNYVPQWLVRGASLNLFPGSAKRVYFEIELPPNLEPGAYAGTIQIQGENNAASMTVPVSIQVDPIKLESPDVYFAAGDGFPSPDYRRYGFNTLVTGLDVAKELGLKGFINPYALTTYAEGGLTNGKKYSIPLFAKEKDFLHQIVEANLQGKGPRIFFGTQDGNGAGSKATAAPLFEAHPKVSVFAQNVPLYAFPPLCSAHNWHVVGVPAKGTQEALEAAGQSGEPFWFLDGVTPVKEQMARFTFGFWLWRLGASGRFASLSGWDGMGGPYCRYHAHFHGMGMNTFRPFIESLTPGVVNPTRDLVLIREGIRDYRYIYTLEQLVKIGETKKSSYPALREARKFIGELRGSLSLDCGQYYFGRSSDYVQNFYPLPGNPWTAKKFDETRRQCAEHILALQNLPGKQP